MVIGDGDQWLLKEFPSKPHGADVRARVVRYDGLVASIVDFLEANGPIVAIYIEGYAFSRNGASQRWPVEFGGLLRWHLVDVSPKVKEVPPTTLKKFTTGKGNTPKSAVLAHVVRRWGELFDSDDAGDAFALHKLGLVAEGKQQAVTREQREAIAVLIDSEG